MNALKSLLFLTEADLPEGPIAVEDLVKFFPSKHSQAIQKLWGTDRLTYKGQQFFANGEFGPVYTGSIKAGEHYVKNEGQIELSIDPMETTNASDRAIIQDAENEGYSIPEFQIELSSNDMQEVYLGYQPSTHNLFIGFDAWVDTDEADEKIEKYVHAVLKSHASDEDDLGQAVDEDDLGRAVEEAILDELKHHTMVGALVELKSENGKNFTPVDLQTAPGGFYRGLYKSMKHLGLIDLRLD